MRHIETHKEPRGQEAGESEQPCAMVVAITEQVVQFFGLLCIALFSAGGTSGTGHSDAATARTP